MPKSLSATLAVVYLLCLCPQALSFSVSLSQGTSGGVLHWPTAGMTYYLHPACSDDLPTDTCLNELRASFDAWEGVNCSVATFAELGTSNSLASTALGYGPNGMNEVAFIESQEWFYGAYVVGVTGPTFYADGDIIEADIALNGYWHTWSTSGEAYTTDVRNITVHEVGHYFGLGHVLDGQYEANPPTMAPSADPFMATRTPEADDNAGLCFLYPSNSWSCSSDSHCPLITATDAQGEYYAGQLLCSNGTCDGYSNTIVGGDIQLGQPCISDAGCAGDAFCQPLDDGQSLCSVNCTPSSLQGCPEDFLCFPYANYPDLGACLPLSLEGVGDSSAGDVCTAHTECDTGLCVLKEGEANAYCRTKCGDDANCGVGATCADLNGVPFGACMPTPATKLLGEPCASSEECTTTLCAGDADGYFCTTPCESHLQCPDGWFCEALAEGGGGCMGDQTAPTGSPCMASSECLPGLHCADFDGSGEGVCSAPCTQGTACGCGFICSATTDGPDLWCAPGPKVACVADGAPCSENSECLNGTCAEGLCRTSCTVGPTQTGCPLGTACLRHHAESVEGYCGPPGALPVSSPCVVDGSCQTLVCVDGRCAQPCDPLQAGACGPGETCTTQNLLPICAPSPGSGEGPPTIIDDPAGGQGVQPPLDRGGVPFTPHSPLRPRPDNGGCSGGEHGSPSWWLPTLLMLGLWRLRTRRLCSGAGAPF